MNSVQIHLALTHVPVILSLLAFAMLAVSFFIKNTAVTKTSYVLLVIAGLAALPVFFTGEGTEEAIEKLPGVSEDTIETHEDVAKLATIAITIVGVAALTALLFFRSQIATRVVRIAILLLSITSGALMVQTAHLGGQIRHTELRSGVALQNENENRGYTEDKTSQHDKDDD